MTTHHEEAPPKTLFEARNQIKALRALLSGPPKIPAGTKPIPIKVPSTNPALPANPKGPKPLKTEIERLDTSMGPRALSEFLGNCTTPILKAYLSAETAVGREQDSCLTAAIYREIKRREK